MTAAESSKRRRARTPSRRGRQSAISRPSTREAEALMGVARMLTRRLGVVTVCQRIVEYVLVLLPIRFSAIGLLDPAGTLHVVARDGDPLLSGGGLALPRGVGVTGRAVQEGRPLWSGDVRNDKRFVWPDQILERLIAGGQRALLAVPLGPTGRTIGALTVADQNAREFTAAEVKLVQAFADLAAIAIENAQLYEEAERRQREAEQLAQVARTMSAAPGVSAVASHVAESLVRTFGARAAGVTRIEGDGALVVLAAQGGVEPLPAPGTRLRPGNGMLEMAVREGRPCWSPDVLNDSRIVLSEERRRFTTATGLRSVLAVSLVAGGRVLGALSIGFEVGRTVSEREIAVVQALADLAASALDKAYLYDEAQQRRREAEALSEITRRINSSSDLDTVLARVVESARDVCGSDLAGLAIREADAEHAVFRYALGARRDWRGVAIAPSRSAAGAVLATGRPFTADTHANDRRADSEHQDACAAEGVVAHAVVPIRRNDRIDGVLCVANHTARPFTDRDVEIVAGLAEHAAVAIHDAQLVTEWGRAWEALRHTERRYRLLAEHMTDMVTLTDMNLVHTYVSPSVAKLRGYTPEEALKQTLGERMTPASADLLARMLSEELAIEASGGGDPRRIRTLELELYRKDGSTVWVETTTTLLRDEVGHPTGIIAVSRNIADRKRAEAALRASEAELGHAQRMEAVGRLAGGIAHDFNNLVTIITGRSEVLLQRLALDEQASRDLELIKTTAARAGTLTKQLLAFSRKQMLRPQVLDLNGIVAGMAPLLERLIGEDVQLVTLLDPNLGAVHADPTQIEQIILNLVVNARDSMPRGGRLRIETANVSLDDEFVAAHPGATLGAHVLLQVSDTGSGMSPEVRAHIFEPFFTTKEVGRGTGLGLATVYGSVKQHDGYIDVESAPSAGAMFRIYLARLGETRGMDEPDAAATTGRPRRSHTILVVEDEAPVLELVLEVLESSGFQTLAAASPAEAFDVARRHGGPIHLLLTDVVMPQMTGRVLAERLRAEHPEMRVLYMSGYAEDAIMRQGVLAPGTTLLPKPFTLDALTRKVREALEREPQV